MASPYEYNLQIDMRENYAMGFDTECHQNDTLTIKCEVRLEGLLFDLTNYKVRFYAKRPDGNDYIQNDATYITKGLGYVNIKCDDRLTIASGMCKGAIHFYNTVNEQITTRYINIKVFADPLEVNRKVSESTITQIDYVNRSLSELESANTDIEEKLALATLASADLVTKTNSANTVNSTLTVTTTNANNSKIALDLSKTSADTSKIALDGAIVTATTKTSTLTAKNAESTLLITSLTGVNTTAQATKVELIDEVVLADQKILDLQKFDPNSVVQNTNTLLNEILCNNELLSFNHGLNCYPIVQLVYTEYGFGIGGYNDNPLGATSKCNLMQNATDYLDKNNITIYVPLNYYIAGAEIKEVNKYKYVVTFPSSTRSIVMNLQNEGMQTVDLLDGGDFSG